MRLRIATFNLENLGAKPGHRSDPGSLAARIEALHPQLLRLEADVLCLQEINGQKRRGGGYDLAALDALLETTDYAGFERVATERGPGQGALDIHNLAILSRYPIANSRQVFHEVVTPPVHRMVTADPPAAMPSEVAWERPLLHATLTLPSGQPLHVLNLHLRSALAAHVPGQKSGPFAWKSVSGWAEGFFLAAMKRAGQALEGRLLVDALFDEDAQALIAVCGDCNAEARETSVRLLAGDEEDTGNSALAGRALVAVERSVPSDLRYSVLHNGRKTMLDHLLVSRALMGWYRQSGNPQ